MNQSIGDMSLVTAGVRVPQLAHEREAVERDVRPLDVDGPTLVTEHAQPNEDAWLLGQALLKAGLLPMQQLMGVKPLVPTS
jgi:hypothetical protein